MADTSDLNIGDLKQWKALAQTAKVESAELVRVDALDLLAMIDEIERRRNVMICDECGGHQAWDECPKCKGQGFTYNG